MKKQTYAFIFAVTMAVMLNAGHAYGQFSEAIQADIPFAFSVGNKTLPEGNYTIRPAGNGRRMWRLQARDGKASQFLLAGNLSGVRGDQGLWLSFHRYGTKHYLAGFRTDSYQVGLPTSSSEKVLRPPGGDILDMGAATAETETVVARSLRDGDTQIQRKEIGSNDKRNK